MRISLLLLVFLVRIPVLQVEKLPLIPLLSEKHMNVTQYHSVSLTTIETSYCVTSKGIELTSVDYEDQGGAGMPNGPNTSIGKNFHIEKSEELSLPLHFILMEEYKLKIDDVAYQLDGKIEIDVKKVFLIELLLSRLGVI